MDKDLATGQLGTVGAYDLALHGTQLAMTMKAGVPVGGVDVTARIEMGEILALLKAKIPGTVDDAIIDIIIAALKA